jgi:Holliday junction resolvase RusA-like endonuclease
MTPSWVDEEEGTAKAARLAGEPIPASPKYQQFIEREQGQQRLFAAAPVVSRFEITVPPSLNGMYFNFPGHGRVPTTKYTGWKAIAGWEIRAANPTKISGPYRFTLLLPEKLRGDIDNRVKATLDLLVSLGVTPDDSKAVETVCRRDASVKPGRCIVVVSEA